MSDRNTLGFCLFRCDSIRLRLCCSFPFFVPFNDKLINKLLPHVYYIYAGEWCVAVVAVQIRLWLNRSRLRISSSASSKLQLLPHVGGHRVALIVATAAAAADADAAAVA